MVVNVAARARAIELAESVLHRGRAGLEELVADLVAIGLFIYGLHDLNSPATARRGNRLAMIGSDGLPHDAFPHPRLWGTFPRVLGHYVRDLGVLSMEDAVRKMTGHTADVFGLVDRGVIRVGAYADLALFDPSTVRDAATFNEPTKPAEGILETWVNGASAYVHGLGATAARGGRLVTRNQP